MAMPASGSIAIKNNTLQTCSSICAAVVAGGGSASGSLCALSLSASKIAPHCMREFYGYAPVTTICINLYVNWEGMVDAGDGMGGSIQLKCGSTVVCQSCVYPYEQGTCFFVWNNVPAGTYCVYGGNMQAYNNYSGVFTSRFWFTSTASCWTDTTNAFSTNETVDFTISDGA